MSPPPLPRIDAAEILDSIMDLTGDRALVEEIGAAIKENVQARYDAADAALVGSSGVPDNAFSNFTNEPGTPGNPLSADEAAAVFAELASLDYIPFDYPVDGCFARAHEMSRVMQEQGIASAKVFNYEAPNRLRVPGTEFGNIEWGYHVAPIVNVTGSDGVTREMVFDPSLNRDRPMTIEEWQTASGGPAGQRIETTSSDTYYYGPANVMDPSDRNGTILTDPQYVNTNATLDYMSVQRDLARAGM
jgi:hypothetical protein